MEPLRYLAAVVSDALIDMRDHEKYFAIKVEAQSLSEEAESYLFAICSVVRYSLLCKTQHVRKQMQSPTMHVEFAVNIRKKTDLQN